MGYKPSNLMILHFKLSCLQNYLLHGIQQLNLTSSQADWYFIPSSHTERIIIKATTTADNYSTLCVVIVREVQQ